jgi:hypothetical protein
VKGRQVDFLGGVRIAHRSLSALVGAASQEAFDTVRRLRW